MVQMSPAQIFPSKVCPRQSRPTIAATIATPRCAIVIPIYVNHIAKMQIPIRREGVVSVQLNQE